MKVRTAYHRNRTIAFIAALSITLGIFAAEMTSTQRAFAFEAGYARSTATGVYVPCNPSDPSHANSIRRTFLSAPPIARQDVYGRILTESFYYYRELLSAKERQIYDLIYSNMLALNSEAFDIPRTIRTNRIWDVFESVMFDNPDVFWVDYAFTYYYDHSDYVFMIQLEFNSELMPDLDGHKRAFYNAADSILEYAMNFDKDIDKVKFCHDLLVNINKYERNSLDQNAYSALLTGKSVCAGYSKAFQYLMQRLGIHCTVLTNKQDDHMWNLLLLGGEYYEMDITGNDPIDNHSGRYYYTFFNVKSNQLGAFYARSPLSGKLPYAHGTTYSYVNYFRNSPGSDFQNITYGKPKSSLPHVYSASDRSDRFAPAPDNEAIAQFVTRLYDNVLGRAPEPGGLSFWSGQLSSRASSGADVARGFFFSLEFRGKNHTPETFVDILYKTLLNRASDASGMAYWVNLLNSGMSRESVFAGFVNSIEFEDLCFEYGIVA